MAHLPGRDRESTLKRLFFVLLLLLAAAPGTSPLRAQERGDSSPPGVMGGYAGLSLGVTRAHGEFPSLLGAMALVELSPRWRVGGAGYFLSHDISFGPGPDIVSKLRFGYGGVLLERRMERPFGLSDANMRLTLLLGAGSAELRQVLGAGLESDNFMVVEPGILMERSLWRRISAGASLRYRLALSVQDLDRVDEGDLSGITLAFHLRMGPF